MIKKIFFIIPLALLSCNKVEPSSENKISNPEINHETNQEELSFIEPNSNTILSRFILDDEYMRAKYSPNEFGYFLQHLPLKPVGSKVLYFDGSEKNKQNVYNSVIDLPIGTKDLHQCADATMRLRADFLYEQKRYDEIAFNFLSDGQPRHYTDFVNGDYSPEKYWQYLEHIFNYANTASLKNQLRSISYKEVKIGDILIQKGNPYGHAVIVVDLAQKNNDTYVLLAQSYMPAQELQILDNLNSDDGSPWYKVENGNIYTPEWNFTSEDWKTWE